MAFFAAADKMPLRDKMVAIHQAVIGHKHETHLGFRCIVRVETLHAEKKSAA
jgi:hypothetical protein